ncbi:MAG: hypothetical protein ABJN35_13995, partial [Erythrobacter sp.]
GTAYLRALMHEDGNIRYANYQSEQEVIDYLTANGYDESTFGDWFGDSSESAANIESADEVVVDEAELAVPKGDVEFAQTDIEAYLAQHPGNAVINPFEQVPIEFFG